MTKLVAVIAVLIAYTFSIRFVRSTIARISAVREVPLYRREYISKTLNLALSVFFLLLLVGVLGIEYSQLTIFLSSIFAVVGIALFAQWSILSNITASLIIFFSFPYRIGDFVQVVDKDDDISGVVEEITLFHVLIRRGEDLITYPNSLILQKAVVKRASGAPTPQATSESPASAEKVDA